MKKILYQGLPRDPAHHDITKPTIMICLIIIIIKSRDYQETLHQSQEQMEGAQAILDSSQVLVIIKT